MRSSCNCFWFWDCDEIFRFYLLSNGKEADLGILFRSKRSRPNLCETQFTSIQKSKFSNQKKNKTKKSPFLFVIQARAILLFIINIIIAVYYYVKKLNYDGNKNKGEWQFGFISLLHYYFSLFRVFVVCCVQKCWFKTRNSIQRKTVGYVFLFWVLMDYFDLDF